MNRLITFLTLFFFINIAFGQNYQKLYDQGVISLQQKKYKQADSLLTLAFNKLEKNTNINLANHYFNRGVSRLNLTDTLGFCIDMKTAAFDYKDDGAKKLYKKLCIKDDKKAYNYYNVGLKEFNKTNYSIADSILTLSINSQLFVDNGFLRGLAKLHLKDTNSFCLDMKSINQFDDKAAYNYNLFCIDTTFYDGTFTRKVNKSSFFEVQYRPPHGYVYDLTKGTQSFALFNVIDTLKAYQKMDNNYMTTYNEKITTYVNKKIRVPDSIKVILKANEIEEYYFIVICIASETGNLIHFENGSLNSKQLKRMDLTDEEKKQFNDTLLNLVKEVGVNAPKPKPLFIGDRAVKGQYVFMVKFKI